MKKHLYFHCGNMQQAKAMREDQMMKHPAEFDPLQDLDLLANLFANEYSILETPDHYYHFLVGQMKQEGCPWCGNAAEIIKGQFPNKAGYSCYCVQCVSCGARGPTLNVAPHLEMDQEHMDEIKNILWQRYHKRRSWDDKLVNPYESHDDKN